jgi:hypothetical protein
VANSVQKQCGTFHDAAAEHNDFWNEHCDQIRKAEAKITSLAGDGSQRPWLASICGLADFFGG